MQLNLHDVHQVLLDVLAAVGAFSGFAWAWESLSRSLSRWHLRRLFQGVEKVCLICPVQSVVGGPEKTYTTHHDLVACAAVATLLKEIKTKVAIRLPHQLDQDLLRGDLVLICGPVGNARTKEFLERTPLPYEFGETDQGVVLRERGATTALGVRSADYDYAMVAWAPSPWNSKSVVFLLAGIGGTGTEAAAAYFADTRGQLCRISRAATKRGRTFATVLRVARGEGGQVLGITPVGNRLV